MDLRDLRKMTVVKLREEALQMGGFIGVHGMNKQQLIAAMAPRLGIDLEAETKAAREKFSGNKMAMKQEIRQLKTQRDAALEDHDMTAVVQVRKSIKKYKRALRRMAKQTRATAV
jgi:hypothetical protein